MDIFTPQQAVVEPSAARYAGFNAAQRELHAGRPERELFSFPSLEATGLVGIGNGAPDFKEVGISGIQSLFMEDDGDDYTYPWLVPADLDPAEAIEVAIEWSQEDAADTGSCLWTVNYLPIVMGVTAYAVPTAVLDVIIPDQVDLAANIPQLTKWGKIDAGKTGIATLRPGIDKILFLITATTLTTITDCALIAGRVIYGRRFNG